MPPPPAALRPQEALAYSSNCSNHQVPFIPLSYSAGKDDDDFTSAIALTRKVCTDWIDFPACARFTRFTDGITNTLLKVDYLRPTPDSDPQSNDEEAILLRAYGNGTDVLIDRQRETQNHELLSRYGLAPKLLARFENGIIYRFTPGKPTAPDDLSIPQISVAIARRLAKWHALVPCIPGPTGYDHLRASWTDAEKPSWMPSDLQTPQKIIGTVNCSKPSPNLWTVLQKWILALPTETEAQKTQQATLQNELRDLVKDLSQRDGLGEDGLVFAHCDLLSGNIIVLPPSREAEDFVRAAGFECESDDIKNVGFIDYEYATPSPAAFDIANHFAEWAGFACDYSKLPTISQRKRFISQYILIYFSHRNHVLGTPLNKATVDRECSKLLKEVDVFRGLPGFYWGIWALIQATISKIDFDYATYAELRLGEYWAWRDEEKGTRKAEGREMHPREKRWAEL